jgi:uncharacterized phage protein (TIGR01671 family)
MREIKFRAWHVEDKYWINSFYPLFNGYGNHGIHRLDGVQGDHDEDLLIDSGEVILCQYTGLKAKNGKEIYEGDIVTIDSRAIGGTIVQGEVIFCDDQTLSRLEYGLWTNRGYLPTDFMGEIEVIGNIYENPKLLEK